QPLEPAMSVRVKPPMIFDWEDVTDASQPVAYELQIATDSDFDAKDIVLEKTALKKSDYTLTEEEEIELLGNGAATYYWHVRSIDAAQNASQWTGAGEFSAATPFKIPDWALYTILGLGGLLLFGIGYLIGRRSGFYY
ncbi:hypothetical protein ACFLXH_06830, partial [Chloroflexota bacterium]